MSQAFLISAFIVIAYYAITMFAPTTKPELTRKSESLLNSFRRSNANWEPNGYIICISKHGTIDSSGRLHCSLATLKDVPK